MICGSSSGALIDVLLRRIVCARTPRAGHRETSYATSLAVDGRAHGRSAEPRCGQREAGGGARHASGPADRLVEASANQARSSSPTVSAGSALTTGMPWPATWLRMRWSRKSGTTTNWAKRPRWSRSISR